MASPFERHPRSAEAWIIRLGRPTVPARTLAAFETWLAANPRNLEDYASAKALLADARALRAEFVGDLNMIPRAARARSSGRRFIPIAAGGLVAAALVVAVWPSLMAGLAPDPMEGAQTYQTATGEIRDVVLPDGSRLTLDTATTLRARIDGPVRRVVLDRGAAYFAVARDRARPFHVAVADREVVVTGTHFTTTLRDGQARVALMEGSVTIADPRRDAVRLTPGDQVSYQIGAPVRLEARIDPAKAEPWRERRLVFEDAALSEVLVELSRYTRVRMRIVDPALGRQRVTAIFPLDGAGSVIDRADKLLPVTLTRDGPGEVTVRGR